jgi:glycosyltransferase involved in cell wall biosynthesis
MKKLLMISYYWPPLGGPGSLRPVKFAKYLPQFNIEPIVLTRKDIAYHSIDTELNQDVAQTTVIRTESLDPARILHLMGMRTYRPQAWQRPIKQKLNFPDHKLPWMPFAFSAGIKLNYDCIYATAPPFSAFIIAYMISKHASTPLILDFRDAWLEFPFLPYEGRFQQHFVSYWERKLVEYASHIIVVDDNIREALLKRYPYCESKIHVIPNGYDEDDFKSFKQSDVFTIAHLGTIREERDPCPFLKAVLDFSQKRHLSHNALQVKFIGHVEDYYLHRLQAYSFVSITGHLPYHQALKEFCSSHCAVMITTGDTYFFPSRQNEYLASGLPILLCGRSKGMHILEDAFKRGYPGWVFDHDDNLSISRKVDDIYSLFKKGNLIRGKTPYLDSTRRKLTQYLSSLINQL